MLVVIRSAGVALQVNLRNPLKPGVKARDLTWLYNPGQTSPEVQIINISGPTRRTAALQNFFLKKIIPGYVSTTALRRLNSVLSMDTSVSLEMNSSVQVIRSWPQPMLMLCSGAMVIPSAKRTPPPQSRDLHCKNVSYYVISNTVNSTWHWRCTMFGPPPNPM